MRRLIQFVAIIALVIPTASCVSTPGRAGISLGGCQPRARTSSGRYQDRTRLHDEYRSVLAPAPQALYSLRNPVRV